MKKSLYQIGKEYEEIAEQLEYGELTPDLEKALSITQEELQTKAVNYGFVVKQFESDVNAIDEEIKRLQAMKKSKVNAVDRLKQTLTDAMLHYGIEKVEVPTLKLSFRQSKSVEITDEKQVPDFYKNKKIQVSIDKNILSKDLKAGFDIKGAKLVTKQNLQIK